ncbi:TolC family protein [Arcticibacter sp. MXS-1]|uniref:TolC family protein n=1 Tax=Arcticibacter sp. MXS-1 TaxID=3341726 RepID=UPI0035A9646E
MRRNCLLAGLLLLVVCIARGQEQKLSLDEYLGLIREFHPLARQAGLNTERAMLVRRQAIGGFDPKLEVEAERKTFTGKEYYNYLVPQVKIPVWYGIDLKASYTSYKGEYVNPENKVPADGLASIGLKVPLGKGLFLDERRAALKQASVFQAQAKVEQQQALNNLFLSAVQVYLEWTNAWLNTQVYQDAVALSRLRAEGTRSLFQNGDKPAIDTIEASVVLQSREQRLQEYQMLLTNKKNELASFLWLEDLSPVDPAKLSAFPDTTLIQAAAPDSLLRKNHNDAVLSNLDVQSSELKIDQLDIERRLKLEEVKPDISVDVALLNAGKNPMRNIDSDYWRQNQKIGLNVSLPLTFTKQRASYSLSKLKIREAEYSLSEKKNTVALKWNNYLNEYSTINELLKLNKRIQQNNKLLLQGEELKFRLGDSSMFMINSREQKVLETQEKLYDLYTKRSKIIQTLRWLTNDL